MCMIGLWNSEDPKIRMVGAASLLAGHAGIEGPSGWFENLPEENQQLFAEAIEDLLAQEAQDEPAPPEPLGAPARAPGL